MIDKVGGGTSNAVNLTDGLDGLAIMPTVMIANALAIFAYVAGNAVFSRYLGVPFIPGAGELVIRGATNSSGHSCAVYITIERDGARYIEEWIRSHADLIKSEGLLDA